MGTRYVERIWVALSVRRKILKAPLILLMFELLMVGDESLIV